MVGARARRAARRGRAVDPLRHRHGDAAADDGRGRRRRDRPRLARSRSTTGWARGRRDAASRGTSIRRCCSARGRGSRRRCATCSRAPAGRPGHIFNLGHGVLPRTDPDVLGRVRELVHAETSSARRPVRQHRRTPGASASGVTGPPCSRPTPSGRPDDAACPPSTLDASDAPMTPGRIVVDRVSQRFRVSTQPQRTLKDMFVARGRSDDARGLGAARRLARGRAGRGGRARRPQRLRQDDAAEARLRHLQADLRPDRGRRPRRLAARARRRLPPGLHRPRERLPQRLDLRPLARPRSPS